MAQHGARNVFAQEGIPEGDALGLGIPLSRIVYAGWLKVARLPAGSSYAEGRSSDQSPARNLRWLPPPAAARLIFEVQQPPAVIPFQGHLPPAERHLRIGIERADVRPGRRRVLLADRSPRHSSDKPHSSARRSPASPADRSGPGATPPRGCAGDTSASAGRARRWSTSTAGNFAGAATGGGGTGCISATGVAACAWLENDDGNAWARLTSLAVPRNGFAACTAGTVVEPGFTTADFASPHANSSRITSLMTTPSVPKTTATVLSNDSWS